MAEIEQELVAWALSRSSTHTWKPLNFLLLLSSSYSKALQIKLKITTTTTDALQGPSSVPSSCSFTSVSDPHHTHTPPPTHRPPHTHIPSWKRDKRGASPVIQWLRLHTSTAGEACLIPHQGTKIPQAVGCGQIRKGNGRRQPEELLSLGLT